MGAITMKGGEGGGGGREMGASNKCMACLNLVAMVCSLGILSLGIWLASSPKHHHHQPPTSGNNSHEEEECVKVVEGVLIGLGLGLSLLSCMGLLGSSLHVPCLLQTYLFLLSVIFATLFGFTAFTLAITTNALAPAPAEKVGANVGQLLVDEYRLSSYGGWLPRQVENPRHWHHIANCLRHAGLCASSPSMLRRYTHRHFDLLQLGCCKPPSACQYTYINDSLWVNPQAPDAHRDCHVWSNNLHVACWECDTCKAGLLANVKHAWDKVALINVIILAIVTSFYTIGCFAFQNTKKHTRYYRPKAYDM